MPTSRAEILSDVQRLSFPFLSPLFISAFRIAQDLAMAMEAGCYGASIKRTRMNAMKLGKRDLQQACCS